jgi:hypothetical protein
VLLKMLRQLRLERTDLGGEGDDEMDRRSGHRAVRIGHELRCREVVRPQCGLNLL